MRSPETTETELPYLDPATIDNHFPKPSYREGQREAIEFAINAYNNGKKLVIIEGPTGSGKSSIGMTIADMMDTSYYLTVTKILQDQLTDDFGDQIVELKGRNAYPCTFWKRYGQNLVDKKLIGEEEYKRLRRDYPDCATGFCKTKYNRDERATLHRCVKCFTKSGPVPGGRVVGDLTSLPDGMDYSACPYYEQVYQAMANRKVVMNFSSFLFQTQMTKRFDEPRDLLILDEAHNVENQLLSFVEVTISDYELQHHGIFLPEFELAAEYAAWFEDANVGRVIKQVIKEAHDEEKHKVVENLMRLLTKYNTFMYSMQNKNTEWVCNYEEKRNSKGNVTHRSVTLKPVFVSTFTNSFLLKYGKRALLMSATILDVNTLCRSLGLKRSEVAAYRMKNRFPVEKRPIYLQTVARMTGGRGRMEEWAPQLTKKVDEICNKYEGKKGIIHTHNFAIMDYLLRHCCKEVRSRLMNQHNYAHKGQLLEAHAQSKDGIIIAPAMHEGIDLADDLSRFQIICKVPYANFFDDQQLGRRVEIDRRYYTWITALKIVQSYGRSIRSDTDYADTYILDESIYKFLDDAGSMMPGWFTEALIK